MPNLGAESAGEKSMAGVTMPSRVAEWYRKAVGRSAFLSNLRERVRAAWGEICRMPRLPG